MTIFDYVYKANENKFVNIVFSSTPVRESVDAGQPDSNQNPMIALATAKEAHKATANSATHSNASVKNTNGSTHERKKSVSESKSSQKASKSNINVTTNPLDISFCATTTPMNAHQGSTKGRSRSTGNFFCSTILKFFFK